MARRIERKSAGLDRVMVGFAALVIIALVGIRPVDAQVDGEAGPDFSSGWVLRSSEVVGGLEGGSLAGTPALGYVVIGPDGLGHFSRDGIDWAPITLPEAGDVLPITVGAGPRGFVAIGDMPTAEDARVRVPHVWYSATGRSWERIDPSRLPSDVITMGGLTRVVAAPTGFVVIGVEECAVFAWSSSDGRSWSRAVTPERCGQMVVTHHDGGWISAAIVESDVVVMSSPDGLTWQELAAANPPPQQAISRESLSSDGESLVLAGAAFDEGVLVEEPRVWVSADDGNNWMETTLALDPASTDSELALFPMTVTELGFVGTFYRESRDGLLPGEVVYSPDGSTWTRYPLDYLVFDLVAANDSVVALTAEGVYTWTPAGSELLALTGTNLLARTFVALGLIVAGGLFVRFGVLRERRMTHVDSQSVDVR